MSKILYLAEFNYGRGHLVSFESDRETEKNYMVVDNSKKEILPNSYIWISSRVGKEKNVFLSEIEAVEFLRDQAKSYAGNLQKELSKANSQIKFLEREIGILENLNEIPSS